MKTKKNIITKSLLVMLLIVLVTSCSKDKEISKLQWDFKVESKQDSIITKDKGETTFLTYIIKRDYGKGAQVSYKLKSSHQLSEFLSNDGNNTTLEKDKTYPLNSDTLKIKYTGKEEGNHLVSVIFTNDKGKIVSKGASITYKSNNFNASIRKVTVQDVIYQGDEIDYEMVIQPTNEISDNYKIIFNSYPGQIYLYDEDAIEIGKEYEIRNIKKTIFRLQTAIAGENTLTYTIKNNTTSHNFEYKQNVSNRGITIDNLYFIEDNVIINTDFTLVGIVKNNPQHLNAFHYKTWISNVNERGIETTNNAYTNGTMQFTNGNVNLKFKALKVGDYKFNIQFKDLFGNESEVKTFDLKVNPELYFKSTPIFNIKQNFLSNFWNPSFHGIEIRDINFEVTEPLVKMKIYYKMNLKIHTYNDTYSEIQDLIYEEDLYYRQKIKKDIIDLDNYHKNLPANTKEIKSKKLYFEITTQSGKILTREFSY